MDFGDPGDMRWMLDTYPEDEMIQVLKKSKGLSRKSAWFWAAHFNIAVEDNSCLKKPFLPKRNNFLER